MTEDEVKAIRIPVTVLIGESNSCRPLYVAPLQQIRADWPVTLVPDAGHLNCIFQPGFAKGVEDWLDRQTR